MSKVSFFFTEIGMLSIAGLIILLAFPLITLGVNEGFDVLVYVGMVMIIGAMASAPAMSLVKYLKKHVTDTKE